VTRRAWRAVGALLAACVVVGGMSPSPARAAAAPSPPRIETFDVPTTLVHPSTPGGVLEDHRRYPRIHVLLPAGYDDHDHGRPPPAR
jgi:hypothetical protein